MSVGLWMVKLKLPDGKPIWVNPAAVETVSKASPPDAPGVYIQLSNGGWIVSGTVEGVVTDLFPELKA